MSAGQPEDTSTSVAPDGKLRDDPTATQVVGVVHETPESTSLVPARFGVAASCHDVPFHVIAIVTLGESFRLFADWPTAVHAAAAVQETPARLSVTELDG